MTEGEKKEKQINVEEWDEHELEELYNFEQKQKRKKKKRRKLLKLQNDLSDFSGEEEIARRRESSTIWDNPNIPQEFKEKYVQYECNPLVIIVGNIPLNAAKQEIEEYFKTLILALSPPSAAILQPIKKVDIGETMNFAVIELINKDSKKICKSLEMLEYNGFKLQIAKARGFFDKIYNHSREGGVDPFGNVTTNAPQEDNKIYMGGLPTYLKDHDVRKLCESYGTLRFFKLQSENFDGEIRSKGYCFFEYQDGKITDKAVKGLNGLEIGDRKIKVQRASTNQKMMDTKKMAGAQGGSFIGTYSQIAQPEVQQMLGFPSYTTMPSKVMQMLNLVSADDLQDDDIYNDLIEDIMEECSKFGTIENLVIPRPLQDGSLCQAVGKIFIKFSLLKNTKIARYHLNGRTYNNRTIVCSFYPESMFDSQEYLKNL